jgi:uncharacterized protein YprB with RNaseH-like and TPR domain
MIKKQEIIRCIHRHTLEEHPACFKKGWVNYEFKDDREWERKTGIPWFQFPGYKIGYFDIETDGLFADFGIMLTWCLKEKDGKIYHDEVTKKELFDGEGDKRIVQSLLDRMKDYKIIVGYNSDRFDVPFLRARALRHGLEFPSYGEIYTWDLYWTARSKLRITRKSLDNVCDFLGIKGKTPIDKDVWRKAKYGDPKSLKTVLEHNKGDVIILEELHNRIEFTRKWIRRSV